MEENKGKVAQKLSVEGQPRKFVPEDSNGNVYSDEKGVANYQKY